MSNDKYFLDYEKSELGAKLQEKIDNYYEYIVDKGLFNLWKWSHQTYFRALQHRGKVIKTGENMEFDILYTNHYRMLTQNLLSIVAGERPSFKARSINTDTKSQEQALTANIVMDYYYDEYNLKTRIREAEESMFRYGEGATVSRWDFSLGDIYAVDTNENENENGEIIDTPVRTGDVSFHSYTPLELIRDCSEKSFENCKWLITKDYINKFELAKKFPEHSAKIIKLSNDFELEGRTFDDFTYNKDNDLVPLYTLYHAKGPLSENGREIVFCDSETILTDSALVFDDIPVKRLAAEEIPGMPFGYSVCFDWLPLQGMFDRIRSSIVTNQSTFAGQTFTSQEGSGANHRKLADGLNVIEYKVGFNPPTILDKLKTPPELFKTLDDMRSDMQLMASLPNAVIGLPEPNLKSGLALSIKIAQAIRFNSRAQENDTRFIESVATGLIQILKKFAKDERTAKIIGEYSKYQLQSWTGDDLESIEYIIVEKANPATKQLSGRVEIIEMLRESGVKLDAQQLLTVINTGNTESITEGEQAKQLAIRSETERLAKGIWCEVFILDDHRSHIMDHMRNTYSPEARDNPEIISMTLEHMLLHVKNMQTQDPDIVNIMELLGTPIVPNNPINPSINGSMTVPAGTVGEVGLNMNEIKNNQSAERAARLQENQNG